MLDRSMWFDLVLLCCLEIMSVFVMSSPWMSNLTSFLHCSVALIFYIFTCSLKGSFRVILEIWEKIDTKQKPPETSFPFIYVLCATKRSKSSHSKILTTNSEKYLIPFVFKTQWSSQVQNDCANSYNHVHLFHRGF